MRRCIPHRFPLPIVMGVLGLCAVVLVLARPALIQAQVTNTIGFSSAVPCLSSPATFATTCFANTIYTGNGAAVAAPADPALVQFTQSSKGMLANLGSSSVRGANSQILNGIGSIYGLAYDDGSASGIRRLFAAAYLKRSVAFGPGNPGGIYEYRFATGTWSLATTVPNAWSSVGRISTDTSDAGMLAQIGKQSLGDMTMAPDGRTLYVMNLSARQIERYDLSGGALVRLSPLAIPFNLISTNAAIQADLRPFALTFDPLPLISIGGPLLVVGVVDSAERSTAGDTTWTYPRAMVLNYAVGSGQWSVALTQNLTAGGLNLRHDGSTFLEGWKKIPGYGRMRSWNPWRSSRANLPVVVFGTTGSVHYPQPMLTSITFSQDGMTMYLGLRDRTGDQVFSKNPPPGDIVGVAQGDVLTYKFTGSWQLQGNSVGDTFDDNTHIYPGMPTSTPAHIENFMGALAITMQGTGPTFNEQVVGSSLLGSSTSGMRFYNATGGGITSQQQFIGASDTAGGKSTGLGDVEYLCTYTLIGGRVWQDTDNNGIQGVSESSVANVTLELFQGTSAGSPALATVTTDGQGRYLFAAPPNTPVNIRIAASSRGWLQSQGWMLTQVNRGGNDTTDSDIDPRFGYIEFAGRNYGSVGGGVTGNAIAMPMNRSDERDFDIGLTNVQTTGQIGDTVWQDLNRDGLQDTGEPGIPGVAVQLTPDPNTMALLPGSYPKTLTTLANGSYLFQNLPAGQYTVKITPPTGFSATLRDAQSNSQDTRDSDADASTGYTSPLIGLGSAPANSDLTVDFGLIGGTPDVWVTKSGPPQVLVGQQFSYTLAYGNSGSGIASAVQLVDTLPAGLTFVSASPAPASQSGQTLTWNLGTLTAGQSGSITVTVRAPASIGAAKSQAITNTATISTGTPGDPPGNNTSTSTSQIVRPEIGIAKTAPSTVLVGDALSYRLSYANTGSIAAANVTLVDTLPPGMPFVRFIQNPFGACAYDAATRRISCALPSVAVNEVGTIEFVAQTDVTAAATVANTATISTTTAGDDPSNNSATATTTVQFPNPGVGITISPSPVPVGESGSITISYRNTGTGDARSSRVTVDLPSSAIRPGTLPAGCSYDIALTQITCILGDLPTGAAGTRVLPITLPSDYPADSLSASATIATITPERPADQGDNTASTSVPVVRPNVFVEATGPTSIVGQGSVFWYTLDYGNIYRRNPSLTRDASTVVLRAILPDEVTFLRADTDPSAIQGQELTWNLGTLTARQTGRITIVVQTSVPAGANLHFVTDISSSTPGDDPSDNTDTVDTGVVQPPDTIPDAGGDLRLALHSDLDPQSQDDDPTNGVYVSDGTQIAWPTGEVLDFTPRLRDLVMDGDPLPWPYAYRARVVGWSVAGFTVNGSARDPRAVDSRGQTGCRPGLAPDGAPRLLQGCAYGYLNGANLSQIMAPAPLREDQLAGQGHVYWTQPPAPPMRNDVSLYTVDPLEPAQLRVQVEVDVWIVNAYPGAPIADPSIPEIPVVPLPDPERRVLSQTFDVTLLAPRSIVGPGSVK